MSKIEKLTASKVEENKHVYMSVQLKLDNGLSVQTRVPALGSDPHRNLQRSIEIVNDIVSQIFEGLNPLRQKELDKMITELSAVHNQQELGVNISLAISLCMLKAAAALSNEPLHRYIKKVYDFSFTGHNPVCVYSAIKNDGLMGDFKECSIIPSRTKTVQESFSLFRNVAKKLKEHIPVEENVGNIVMNTVQLEILQNTLIELGYSIHNEVFMAIRPSLRYEEGVGYMCSDMLQPASESQLIDYYKEIQTLYAPLINEDPLPAAELTGYYALHNEINDKAILSLTSQVIDSPAKCKKYANSLPAAMISLDHLSIKSFTLYIDLITAAVKEDWKILIDTNGSGDPATLLAIASAANADFVKIDTCDQEREKEVLYVGKAN